MTGSASELEQALKQPVRERDSRLHRLAELSARFNIGSIHRNFNNPTLALQFLDPQYQFRFAFTVYEQDREEHIEGSLVRKIGFSEVRHPTVIQDDGADVSATGSLWVRVADGAVVRTMLSLAGSKTTPDVSITVQYRRDPKLEMWVPSRMEERYRSIVVAENSGSIMRALTRFNDITCVATYSNFRRFETSGRVNTPK